MVEVLSPSTACYDRGEKLWHYRCILALREVVLVSPEDGSVELHRRTADDRWDTTRAGRGERISIETTGTDLDVDEVLRDGLEGGRSGCVGVERAADGSRPRTAGGRPRKRVRRSGLG